MSTEKADPKENCPPASSKDSFVGTKWGCLTVLSRTEKRYFSAALYECLCICGGKKLSTMSRLKQGTNKSCGCIRFSGLSKGADASKTHDMSKTKTYKTWQTMRQRCENPNNDQYPAYGGRGIKVCERWSSFELFLQDMGERPKGKTIDRIDSNDHYRPENCRWADSKDQANNRRNSIRVKVRGEWVTVRDAAERLNLTISGVRNRCRRGTIEVRNEYRK